MSLKKQKLLRKKLDEKRSKHSWSVDTDVCTQLNKTIDKLDFYVNNKNKTGGIVKRLSDHDLRIFKVYGIKKINWGMHSLALPPKGRLNVFDQYKPKPNNVVHKMAMPYMLYRDGVILNPLIFRTKYIDNNLRVLCSVGFSRIIFLMAVGELVPFSKELEYPAYFYNYDNTPLEDIESILGEGEDNLKEVFNITPEFSRDYFNINGIEIKESTPKIVQPTIVNNWYGEISKDDHLENFWNYIFNHEYELHFYRQDVLECSFNLGKKPLRINIDHDGILSWVGLTQAALWFFFGIDKWQGKQYFSIG